jgi:potassium-transporting ATPase potassium-binding subunit
MIFFLQWMLLHAAVLFFAYPLAWVAFQLFYNKALFAFERAFFQWLRIDTSSMTWYAYLQAFLQFQLLGWLAFYALARLQGLPISPAEAFQQASSFVTNTNWQILYGENMWSMPLRLLGVFTQNFVSAMSGLVVLVVFARAWRSNDLGNFWLDMWRAGVYLFLPVSILFSLLLVSQGVPQNGEVNKKIEQYQSILKLQQSIPMGPIATEVAIKLLGTNGGSYTATNSAHPLENPTPLSHLLGMIAMLLFPVMGCFLFARMYGEHQQGWVIWAVMWTLATLMSWGAYQTEGHHLLGKEWRIGVGGSVMWHVITTATATGATAAIIDHFQPLTTGFYLFLINLGEIAFGGVGMGVVNLIFVLMLAAFIMCLLTGSSPNFLRKPLSLQVIKLNVFYIIFCPSMVLWILYLFTSITHGTQSNQFPSAHVIVTWWYALSSWLNNNGSGLTGYAPMGDGMKYLSGILMLLGRYVPISLVFAVAGALTQEKVLEPRQQTFVLNSILFFMVSIFVILIVTLLAFLPLWSLGPLVEQGLIS